MVRTANMDLLKAAYTEAGIEYPFDKPYTPNGINALICTENHGCIGVGLDGKVEEGSPISQEYVDGRVAHAKSVRIAINKAHAQMYPSDKEE